MEAERSSYRGGLTQVFRVNCELGFVIDINSSYPASMCNPMPLEYVNELTPIEAHAKEYTRRNVTTMVPFYLYRASFRFPDTCHFPSIVTRVDESLVQMLTSEGEGTFWLWGIELIQAIEDCGA